MLEKVPEKSELKQIICYSSLDQLMILKDICNKIYITRNIALNQDEIIHQLERIDILFKDPENKN